MIKRVLLIAMAALMLVALAACVGTENGYEEDLSGAPRSIAITVVYEDGSSEQLEFLTTYAYLGDALLEAGLVEGEQGSMGLMISHVNGVRADFLLDGAWWQFFVNGEASMTGVSDTRIDPSTTYEFRFTPA